MLRRIADYVRTHGVPYTLRRGCEKAAERVLHLYHRQWQALRTSEAALAQQRQQQPGSRLISVIVPVYNTQPDMLLALARSLHQQTYDTWEAVLYDGASTRPETLAALKKAAAMDSRLRLVMGAENSGISGNTNAALAHARGDYCALCDHDDLLTPDALWHVAQAIRATGADMLYSDEDKVTEDGRYHTDPHLKPDFGPDTLRSGNYICHLLILKTSLIQQVGGLRAAFDGSQDHDLALRCSEAAQRIVHIPRILYHWRTVGASMSHQRLQVCTDAACRAVAEQMVRIGYPGQAVMEHGVMRLRYDLPPAYTVRVLLLGGDEASGTMPQPLCRSGVSVQCVSRDDLQAINAAAMAAPEALLLFLDADAVTPIQDDFLPELVMYAQRSDAGVVTPVLLRPGKPTAIAEAGLAVMQHGLIASRHEGQLFAGGGHRAQALTSHNVCAASPACFMLRRDHFSCFTEPLSRAAMVRWCSRLSANGLHHVYTPHARAIINKASPLWRRERIHDRLQAPMADPCLSPYYTYGKTADLKLRKGAIHHAAD